MDNLNKIDSVPAVEALVKEAPIAVAAVVEQQNPTVPAPKPIQEAPNSLESIVLYSIKDINLASGPSIPKGYSKVNKKDSEELLKHPSVRRAGVEEIETYFNK